MVDPNPKINGAGVRYLRDHGIGVRVGVMRQTAMRQNEAHVKFVVTGRPLVVLKIAQTLDGKIAPNGGHGIELTGPAAQKFVHALRARYDAVLVGKTTVIVDDPRLTVRAVKGRDPLRIVLDSWGKLPTSAGVFVNNDDRKTVRVGLAIGKRPDTKPHPDCFDWYVNPDDRHQIDLNEVLETAARNSITSILVEGGGQIFGSFLREKLADKIHILIAPKFLGAGVNALGLFKAPSIFEAVRLVESSVRWVGQDLLITGYPDYDPEPTAEDQPAAEETATEDGAEVVDMVEIEED
jgi:diaminohydroxyphosphoribosylaminopyrimidine deaminase/5-amino-6-(5-phosphoribosylamino)uracil reductase